jgi:hypothetical protein
MYLGDFKLGTSLRFKFPTVNGAGAPTTLSGSPAISVYKADGTGEVTTGVTLTVDFDGKTGLNHVTIDLSDAFYAAGNDYQVVITAGTVAGVSAVGYVPVHFSIDNRTNTALTTLAQDAQYARAGAIGKQVIDYVARTITFYDRDGVTVLSTQTLTPSGSPTGSTLTRG